MLWSLFALLTGGAVFAILWPLARPARRDSTAPDVVFYQAKLEEIARDEARANISRGGSRRGQDGSGTPASLRQRQRPAIIRAQ